MKDQEEGAGKARRTLRPGEGRGLGWEGSQGTMSF